MIRVLIGGIVALAIAMGVARFAFTPILPAMQAATGLGPEGAGLLASLNYLGYLAGAVGAGLVPHGRIRTAVFRASLVLSVGTTAAMGLVAGPADESMAAWSILRFLSGLSSAGIFILGIAIVLDALARLGREAKAGWLYTGVGIGIASSGLFVALTGSRLGWAGDWLALGLICAVASLSSWAWVADRPDHRGPAAAVASAGAERGRRPGGMPAPLVLLAVAYFLEGGGYIVSGTFLVSILKTMPETAALGEVAWILVGIAAAGSGLLWAAVGRRVGPWRGLILAHAAQAVGILLPVTGSPAAAVLSAILFGGTFVGIVSLAFGLGRQLSAGASTRVIGALTAVYGIGQILGPLAAGLMVARTGSYDTVLIAAAAVVGLGALLLALGARLAAERGVPAAGLSRVSPS